MYRIEFTRAALKELGAAPAGIRERVRTKLEAVARDPFAPNNNVKALRGEDAYRLRIGDWRVVYTLDGAVLLLTVIRLARRDKVYG
ncbi:MAG: type II toxin-antitoxin system RelE/ParE family toxin [Tagaea sp.]|nr:type II toxin-antitoxin system RelE/ParE family toxin [Tagaea sp.]